MARAAERARATVSSLEWSSTSTMSSEPPWFWDRSDVMVSAMPAASFRAGITTRTETSAAGLIVGDGSRIIQKWPLASRR